MFTVVTLRDKKIWRRIAIRGNQTLDDLHETIFDAFDREEYDEDEDDEEDYEDEYDEEEDEEELS